MACSCYRRQPHLLGCPRCRLSDRAAVAQTPHLGRRGRGIACHDQHLSSQGTPCRPEYEIGTNRQTGERHPGIALGVRQIAWLYSTYLEAPGAECLGQAVLGECQMVVEVAPVGPEQISDIGYEYDDRPAWTEYTVAFPERGQ